MPFSILGPLGASCFVLTLFSFLSTCRFDPRGGERDKPRVRLGDLELCEVWRLDAVECSVNTERVVDFGRLEDVRPEAELRREVGTTSGLFKRKLSNVRYISLLRYSRWAMSFVRESLPGRDLSSRLDRDLSSRLGC